MSSDPASGAALDDELIGQTVDGFRIEELIGSGGMGRVYKALDPRLERLVALKFLAADASPEFQARVQREARAVSAIHHPHVAQIYSFGDYRGRSYFAMEYVHGGSLAAELGPGRRPTAQRCLSWMLEAACGLEAAYEQGLVHRDVKPSNLLLSGDGKIKLVDFGLVRRLE